MLPYGVTVRMFACNNRKFAMNSKKRLLGLLLISLISNLSIAADGDIELMNPVPSLVNPMSEQGEKGDASQQVAERILTEAGGDLQRQYEGLKGFIEFYGDWITLFSDGQTAKIDVNSYLLIKGHSDVATLLLKTNVVKGWRAYKFLDGVASDFAIAISNGRLDYLTELFKHSPEGLNTPLQVSLDAEPVLPLAMLATNDYVSVPMYDEIVMSMLDAGASPYKKMSSGLSPIVVASANNNMQFVRIVQVHASGQTKTTKGLLSNTPLEDFEVVEMQAIADTWMEKSAATRAEYQYDKLYELWVSMILKGYNVPADLMYEELRSRPNFSIEQRINDGLSPLMAASMSRLYGGNVEYANLLIDRGAKQTALVSMPASAGQPEQKVNYIQLALQRDNYKVVALMISKGVDFVSAPDNAEILLLSEAMAQKAYVSAAVLKEALSHAIEQEAKRKSAETGAQDGAQ